MAARKQVKRDQIIQAATELFSLRRFDEVSIDDIAKAAGVAHGLVFHYFDNKRALWVVVLQNFTEELREINPTLALPNSLDDRVRAFFSRHLIEMHNRPGLYRTIMLGARDIELDGSAFLEHELHPLALSRIFALLEVESPTPALTFVVRCWVSVVEEATLEWLDNPSLVDQQTLVEILLRYLAAALSSANLIDPLSAGADLASELGIDTTR
jgi:AcrR family transcriptional regulator